MIEFFGVAILVLLTCIYITATHKYQIEGNRREHTEIIRYGRR
jgi:hypothetical protein